MKKITKATFKSFVKRNRQHLFIQIKSDFDPMVDCVMPSPSPSFQIAQRDEMNFSEDHTLGIKGLWLVGRSADWFQPYEDEDYYGMEVFNCCGSQVLAVRK